MVLDQVKHHVMYMRKVGKESLYMDAIDFVLPDAYSKLIKDNNLEPVANPNIDIKVLVMMV